MAAEELEAGLDDGTLERGVTRRYAKGTGDVSAQGQLLMPDQVDSVIPPCVTARSSPGSSSARRRD
jgi:hypothetical protein